MKILSLGLDNSILDETSALAKRAIEYGDLVEKYAAIVPSRNKGKIELSQKVMVYASGGGNKLTRLFNIYKIAREFLAGSPGEVITVQDQYYLALIGFLLAKKYRVGLEVQVHGFESCRGLRKLIAGYVLPRAQAVRAVSQRLRKQLIDDFGVAENKITVVPIYTDLRFKNYDLRIKENRDNFVFLTVGRLVEVKNIAMQIEAMAEMVKEFPQARLWIVGDGPFENSLKFKVKSLKIEEKVKFFGWRKDLENFYGPADAFLLTSNAEGWAMAVIEAAFWRLPIVMTDVGCAREVIKNDESGIVILSGDTKGLAAAMEKLISDGNLRRALGEKAYQTVLKLPGKEETLRLYKLSWQIAAGANYL